MKKITKEKELGNVWGVIIPWYAGLALLLFCYAYHGEDFHECVSIFINFLSLVGVP